VIIFRKCHASAERVNELFREPHCEI
jgi:hypothetical protein